MDIRRLEPADTALYRNLMLDAYERHPDAFTSSVAERLQKPLAWWSERIAVGADVEQMVVGALSNAALLGVAGIAFATREKTAHIATIFGMYVDNSLRQSGVGAKLLAALLDEARHRAKITLVQLTVTHGNDSAIRLYKKFGFIEFGVEPMAIRVGAQYLGKVHMWLDLRESTDQ